MELGMRWHRLMRALVGIIFFALGIGAAVFIFSNVNPIDIHWRVPSNNGPLVDWTLSGVSLWLLAAVPLVIGGVLGYFYQTPARLHHFREHMRHMHRVHELEKELKDLRGSLDKVLMMPEDGTLAVPAALMPPIDHEPAPRVAEVSLPEEPSAADLLADFADPEEARGPAPIVTVKSPGRKPSEPRKKLLTGLKEEMAAVKLPPPVPATKAPAARRGGRNGRGKASAEGGRKRARPGTRPKPESEPDSAG